MVDDDRADGDDCARDAEEDDEAIDFGEEVFGDLRPSLLALVVGGREDAPHLAGRNSRRGGR